MFKAIIIKVYFLLLLKSILKSYFLKCTKLICLFFWLEYGRSVGQNCRKAKFKVKSRKIFVKLKKKEIQLFFVYFSAHFVVSAPEVINKVSYTLSLC